MANFLQMMQKAQTFKSKMQEMQARVQDIELTGTAGGDLVTCRVNGRFEVRSLKISPSIIKAGDAEIMEDMIIAALNDARTKAEQLMADETRKVMQDAGLPPGLDLPF